jgi:hypothetical protein
MKGDGVLGLLGPRLEWLKPTGEAAVNNVLGLAGRTRAVTGPSSRWLTPGFVIVGGQRCGTTSMYRYLKAHPQVIPALTKEVHFFDINYSRGPDWYAAHFVAKRLAESRSRLLGRPVVTGEASPYYMFHSHAIRRLHEMLPDTKIIVMLRDPVKRAISHYSHELAKGWETADLAEAVRLEEPRLAGEEEKMVADPAYVSFAHQHYGYLARGDYLPQLQRIHSFYPRDQIIVVNSRDLYRDPDADYRRMLRFLGLREKTLRNYKQYNTYRSAKPDEATRVRLVRYFASRNAALYDYLGEDLGWSR